MFGRKERLKQLEAEKQELLFIKQQLEDSTPKVDISNVYVWKYKGVCNIVRCDIQPIIGKNVFGMIVDGYESTLIDIFSNETVYHKQTIDKIKQEEPILSDDGYYDYAYLLPLHKFDKNLLAYPDKRVPLYVLQQLYYRLNHINVKRLCKKIEKTNA